MTRTAYLGAEVSFPDFTSTGRKFLLDVNKLTTHAFITGMTGSGKTGLAVVLMEELLLNKVPLVVIDLKGDVSNLVFRDPSFSVEKFRGWVDVFESSRRGISLGEYALSEATRWRKGLESSGVSLDKVREFCEETEVLVFTPGSSAGIPVNVIGSLESPRGLDWSSHEEILLDKVSSIASAILELAGYSPEESSSEHVFISSIIEYCWRRGEDLDLPKLVTYVLSPPFTKVGVLTVDQCISRESKKRLASKLNSLIASPEFRRWTQGISLDFSELFWSPEGKPRALVFYLAHLSDHERMFAVTMILQALYTWMFKNPGTTKLKWLLYFDEVYGYAPPYPRKPPSKKILLSLVKRARAFGLGVVLATQNPVDIDYKILSNTGLWFIGRLQTENDRRRILEGIGRTREREEIIAKLPVRVFLVYDFKEKSLKLFKTRWAISYLRGPLTLDELRKLPKPSLRKEIKVKPPTLKYQPPPQVAESLPVLYLEPTPLLKPSKYIPVIYVEADIHIERKRPPVTIYDKVVLIGDPYLTPIPQMFKTNKLGITLSQIDLTRAKPKPVRNIQFTPLPPIYAKENIVKKIESAAKRYIASTKIYTVYYYPALRKYSQPNQPLDSFIQEIALELGEKLQRKYAKIKAKYNARKEKIKRQIALKLAQVDALSQEIQQLKAQIAIQTTLSILMKKKPQVTLQNKIEQKQSKITRLLQEINDLKYKLELLNIKEKEEIDKELEKIKTKIQTILIKPSKKHIIVNQVILLWIPIP